MPAIVLQPDAPASMNSNKAVTCSALVTVLIIFTPQHRIPETNLRHPRSEHRGRA